MTLPKQTVPITFQGLDQKTDPKVLVPGKLTELNNAVMTKANRIDKRYGHTVLPNTTANDTTGVLGTTATRFAKHGNGLLKVANDGYGLADVLAYSTAASAWLPKGKVSSTSTEVIPLDSIRNGSGEGVICNNYYICGVGANNGGKVIIADASTGRVLRSAEISGAAHGFRVFTSGNYTYVFYCTSETTGSIRAYRLDTSSTAFISFDTTSYTSIVSTSGTGSYDVVMPASTIYLVYRSGSNTTTVAIFDNALVAGSTAAVTTSGAPSNYCAVWDSDNSRIFVGYSEDTGNNFEYFVRASDLTSVLGVTEFGTTDSSNSLTVAGFYRGSGEVVFIFQSTTTFVTTTKYRRVNATAAAGSVSDIYVKGSSNTVQFGGPSSLTSVDTMPISIGGSYWAFYSSYNSSAGDSAGFLMRLSFETDTPVVETLARIIPDNAPGFGAGSYRPSRLVLNASGEILAAVTRAIPAVTGSVYSTHRGIALVKANLTTKVQWEQTGRYTYFTGGYVSCFDGENIFEENFLSVGSSLGASEATTGGSLDALVYEYVLVWEWIDSLGVIHQSRPSTPIEADHSGSGTSTNKTTLTVGSNPYTRRFGTAGLARAVWYRNEGSGSTSFYRCDATWTDFPEVSGDQLSYEDIISNTDLIANPPLYTDGGVIANACPPASATITAFKGRLWLGPMEELDRLWYSKRYEEGAPCRFSDELVIDVEANTERPKALHVLTDKLIGFKEGSVHYTYGDGPDNLGFGGQFAPFDLLPNDAGCTDIDSVVTTPMGVIYKGRKGFQLLDFGLNVSYIGAPVEDYNSYTVTSAVVVPNDTKVRFTTAEGPRWTYDYYFQQWSVDAAIPAHDAIAHDGSYHMLADIGATNQVWRESSAVYQDNTTDYTMSLTTGWISLNGFANLQRVYKLIIGGDRHSSASLKVSVGYDYSDTYEDTVTIAANTALTDGAGGFLPFRLMVKLKKQKCQAIRFRFEELTPTGTCEALSLSYAGLEVGLKRGTTKLRSLQVGAAS